MRPVTPSKIYKLAVPIFLTVVLGQNSVPTYAATCHTNVTRAGIHRLLTSSKTPASKNYSEATTSPKNQANTRKAESKTKAALTLIDSWVKQLNSYIEDAWNKEKPREFRNERFNYCERLVHGIDAQLKVLDEQAMSIDERAQVKKTLCSMSRSADYYYRQKSLRFRSNRYLSHLQERRNRCPRDSRTFTRILLYQTFLEIGKTSAEASSLADTYEGDESLMMAIVRMNQGAYSQSILILNQVSSKHNTFDILLLKANCYASAGRDEEALEQLRLAAEMHPHNSTVHLLRSIEFSRRKNSITAAAEIEKAKKVDPTESALYYQALGRLFYSEGNYRQAIEQFDKAIKINPNYADALSRKGECFGLMHDWLNCTNAWTKAVDADPTNPFRHATLGVALEFLHLYEDAIAEYDCALEILPSYTKVHEYKGDCYLRMQNWKLAIQEYEFVRSPDLTSTVPNTSQSNASKNGGKDSLESNAQAIWDLVIADVPSATALIPIKVFRHTENSDFGKEMASTALTLLPDSVIRTLTKFGVSIVIAPTSKEYMIELAKNNPKASHQKIVEIQGFFDPWQKEAVLCEDGMKPTDSKEYLKHLVLHELGHAYDSSIGRVSSSVAFKLRFAQDVEAQPAEIRKKLHGFRDSDLSGCSQLFAEIFAYRYMYPTEDKSVDSNSQRKIAQYFPRCFEYLKTKCPLPETTNQLTR